MGIGLQAQMRNRIVLLDGIVSRGLSVDGVIDDLALRVYVNSQDADWLFQCGALAVKVYVLAFPDDLQWILDTVTVPAWLEMATSAYCRMELGTTGETSAVMRFAGELDSMTELEFFSRAKAVLTRYRMIDEVDEMLMSSIDDLSMSEFELITLED